jgi:hypothetical protein
MRVWSRSCVVGERCLAAAGGTARAADSVGLQSAVHRMVSQRLTGVLLT